MRMDQSEVMSPEMWVPKAAPGSPMCTRAGGTGQGNGCPSQRAGGGGTLGRNSALGGNPERFLLFSGFLRALPCPPPEQSFQ